jgi:uncharacterized protein YuzE
MKIEYDAEVDALYIRLRPAPEEGVENRPISDDVTADYGPDGKLVGIEILGASSVLGEDKGHFVVDVAAAVGDAGR